MKSNKFELFSAGMSRLLKNVQLLKSKKMEEHGLKGATALCLYQIGESKQGLSANELSVQGEIDKAQVSRCMAELIEMGLVFRESKDGKQYRQKYRLTEQGQAVAEDIRKSTSEIQKQIRANLSDEEVADFYHVLDVICGNLNEILKN